jgi:hypothetical protein
MSNMSGAEAIVEVKSTPHGLSAEQAAAALKEYGLNKLLEDAPTQW